MVTIKVSAQLLARIEQAYQHYLIENNGDYVLFRAKVGKTTITAYQNTKGKDAKVTFAGGDFTKEASRWDPGITLFDIEDKEDEPLGWFDIEDQIGSDEVGTGDFLGPITVCAALVRKQDVAYLKKIGVTDSKKMTDEHIRFIASQLLKKFAYSQVSLNNEKYNELVNKGINLNEIKARLHNRVLLNLLKRHPDVKHVYVDKFVSESRYFNYAARDVEIVSDITFKTKGESRFPSVALASVIARYSFLKKMELLGKKYKTTLPFGASHKVDEFAMSFIEKHGREELLKIAKGNFKNFTRIALKDDIK
jgi:ribonuclease HIII